MAAAGTLAPFRSTAAQPPNPRLGMDNFSVRAMGWKAKALVDYAASLALDSLFITDLDAFESLEEAPLKALREYAAARRVQLQVGTWSICPTSKAFKPKWGTAQEHLALGVRVARAVGSPVLRVVLGTWEDRLTDGGIDRHIEQMVEVCRAGRSQATDAGVRIAVENHAGDMHSTELARLVEEAGTDYVGVNFDSGNALWTLEDPIACLETLARYTATTSLRDSAVWVSENGARVAWTAMGEGTIDQRAFFTRFRELCPNVPVHIETISGFNRELHVSSTGLLEGMARLAGARAGPIRSPRAHRTRRRSLAGAFRRRQGEGGAGLPAGRVGAVNPLLQERADAGATDEGRLTRPAGLKRRLTRSAAPRSDRRGSP